MGFRGASGGSEAARRFPKVDGTQNLGFAFFARRHGSGHRDDRPPFASARVRAERIVLGIGIVLVVAVFAVAVVLLDPSLAGIAVR
jgi:hypothetical protein